MEKGNKVRKIMDSFNDHIINDFTPGMEFSRNYDVVGNPFEVLDAPYGERKPPVEEVTECEAIAFGWEATGSPSTLEEMSQEAAWIHSVQHAVKPSNTLKVYSQICSRSGHDAYTRLVIWHVNPVTYPNGVDPFWANCTGFFGLRGMWYPWGASAYPGYTGHCSLEIVVGLTVVSFENPVPNSAWKEDKSIRNLIYKKNNGNSPHVLLWSRSMSSRIFHEDNVYQSGGRPIVSWPVLVRPLFAPPISARENLYMLTYYLISSSTIADASSIIDFSEQPNFYLKCSRGNYYEEVE